MYLLMKSSFAIVNGSIGEGGTLNILHAVLGVPCTIKVINLKAPLFLMLELVNHLLKIATEPTIGRKILDNLKGSFIIDDELLKFLFVNKVRIGHEPLLAKSGGAKSH